MHAGIIPDGMRRWARENDIPLGKSYMNSLTRISEIIDLFFSKGFQALSIYSISKENLKRSGDELKSVIDAECLYFRDFLPLICQKWECRFMTIGDIDGIPSAELWRAVRDLENYSRHYSKRRMYAILNYEPMDDIKNYFEKLKDCAEIPILLSDLSSVKEPLDLVIRTGCQNRISNFLPLNIGYAEIHFINKFFIDTQIEDYEDCISSFFNSERRFGT